jgi:hypothetical protein
MGVVCIEKAIDGFWDKKGHWTVEVSWDEFNKKRFDTMKEAKAYVEKNYGLMACDEETYKRLHKAA